MTPGPTRLPFLPRLEDRAIADIVTTARAYDRRLPGLGQRFVQDLRRTLTHIADMPRGYPIFSGTTRRAIVRGFPFVVLYRVTQDEVIIIGVLPQRLDPARSLDRLLGD